MIQKYKINDNTIPKVYVCFLDELKKAILVMAGKITQNAINEIINYFEDIGEDDNESIIENDNKLDEDNSNKI